MARKHRGEVGRASLILQNHQVESSLCRLGTGRKKSRLFLSSQIGCQAVLDFSLGVEHQVLVGYEELLKPGVLDANAVDNSEQFVYLVKGYVRHQGTFTAKSREEAASLFIEALEDDGYDGEEIAVTEVVVNVG